MSLALILLGCVGRVRQRQRQLDGGVCAFQCPAFDCARLGPAHECNGKPDLDGSTVEVCTGGQGLHV